MLARAVSVTGSGGSERTVEKYHLRTAPSEHASLELSWLVPVPCLCWACWGGHGASAAAPGLEENTMPGKSRLLWTYPMQFPTACQCLPSDERGLLQAHPALGRAHHAAVTSKAAQRASQGSTVGLCSVIFTRWAPNTPSTQPRATGCTRHQPSAQKAWAAKTLKYIFLHLESV